MVDEAAADGVAAEVGAEVVGVVVEGDSADLAEGPLAGAAQAGVGERSECGSRAPALRWNCGH